MILILLLIAFLSWSLFSSDSSLLVLKNSNKATQQETSETIAIANDRLNKEKEFLLSTTMGEIWQKNGFKPKDGIAISLPALHSIKSCGIGEYPDLIPLFSWCKEVGLNAIQLLPILDTDQDPFKPISSCALNTAYIGLLSLPGFIQHKDLLEMANRLQDHNHDLRMDLKTIAITKLRILELYYQHHGDETKKSEGYINFLKQNHDWLQNYALFKSIREAYIPSLAWIDWNEEDRNFKKNREKLIHVAETDDYTIITEYKDFTHFDSDNIIVNVIDIFYKKEDNSIIITVKPSDQSRADHMMCVTSGKSREAVHAVQITKKSFLEFGMGSGVPPLVEAPRQCQ